MSRQTFRVAVIVFCECEGVDYLDASAGAQISLERALRKDRDLDQDFRLLPGPGDPPRWETRIHGVMDAGAAVGNGYMWLEPTGRAYPRKEENQDVDQR